MPGRFAARAVDERRRELDQALESSRSREVVPVPIQAGSSSSWARKKSPRSYARARLRAPRRARPSRRERPVGLGAPALDDPCRWRTPQRAGAARGAIRPPGCRSRGPAGRQLAERAARVEALVVGVPVRDVVLAEAPAQPDRAAADERREVDQARSRCRAA